MICKEHRFVTVARKNCPVSPMLKDRHGVSNFASCQIDVSNFTETIFNMFETSSNQIKISSSKSNPFYGNGIA